MSNELSFYYVYIMSNRTRSVVYIGVTNDIVRRVLQHRNKNNPKCFTAKYNAFHLVYFERFREIKEAIAREKELKGWKRKKKDALMIMASNPKWEDWSVTRLNLDPHNIASS